MVAKQCCVEIKLNACLKRQDDRAFLAKEFVNVMVNLHQDSSLASMKRCKMIFVNGLDQH
jgi:hypothetical protein